MRACSRAGRDEPAGPIGSCATPVNATSGRPDISEAAHHRRWSSSVNAARHRAEQPPSSAVEQRPRQCGPSSGDRVRANLAKLGYRFPSMDVTSACRWARGLDYRGPPRKWLPKFPNLRGVARIGWIMAGHPSQTRTPSDRDDPTFSNPNQEQPLEIGISDRCSTSRRRPRDPRG